MLMSLTEEIDDARLVFEDTWLLIEVAMNAKRRQEALEKHKHKLYEGKDGRWYTRFPKPEGGSKQRAFRTKEEAIDAIVEFYEVSESPTIKDVFTEALDKKLEEGSIIQSTYVRNTNDFIKYYRDVCEMPVSDIDSEWVEGYLRKTKAAFDLGIKGYGHLLSVTRLIFKMAKRKKLVSFRIDDVIADMEWGKNAFRKEERDDSDEVFDDIEIASLVNFFKRNQNGRHLGLLLCFVTGLRIGELSALKWEDIDSDGIYVRRTERSWADEDGLHCEVINLPKTKAGKRYVPIPEQGKWIIDELKRLNPYGEFVFVNKGSRTRTGYFRKAMAKACDALEIKRRSPHKIRKTYASILLDNNVSEKTIIENMGHTNIATTNLAYAKRRRTTKQQNEVVSSISEFDVVAID